MNNSAGTWTTVSVAGHVCDIYEPRQRNEHGYSLIYLHGVHLGRLDQNAVFTAEFERYGLPVIGPRTGRSWWTDRICEEFDPALSAERYVIAHVVPYLNERWGSSPPRIALLGTSMGGQGALRLAFKHPRLFPIAAGLAPAIDYQLRFHDPEEETLPRMYADAEEARQDTATLHVHPLNWPRNIWFACDPLDHRWHESAHKLHSKLSALGIMHELDLESSAGGHGWNYYNHMAPAALRFIAQRLEQERLRLG
jgi:S-formylglutathione hydrolase FrmB